MANENETRILETLKSSSKQVQKIAALDAKEREAYKKQVAELFFELQKTVNLIVSEEYVILHMFEWRHSMEIDESVETAAKLFANKYGFKEDVVLKLYKSKNGRFTAKYILVEKG